MDKYIIISVHKNRNFIEAIYVILSFFFFLKKIYIIIYSHFLFQVQSYKMSIWSALKLQPKRMRTRMNKVLIDHAE